MKGSLGAFKTSTQECLPSEQVRVESFQTGESKPSRCWPGKEQLLPLPLPCVDEKAP